MVGGLLLEMRFVSNAVDVFLLGFLRTHRLQKGVVSVWEADARGSLTSSRQYKKSNKISALVFCSLLSAPLEVNARSRIEVKKLSHSFFFGNERGSIFYADDIGHCAEVQSLGTPIDAMLFYEEKSRLVVITRTGMLTQYHVSDDGKVSRLSQFKLGFSVDANGLKNVVWAGPGVLVMATEEKVVRFMDLAVEESYNISLVSALGSFAERSDVVSSVSFSPIDSYLAVGTRQGLIIVWKFSGPLRELQSNRAPVPATSSSDWELVFRTSLGAEVFHMNWSVGTGMMSVVTDAGVSILNESVIQSRICGDLIVVQDSAHEVSVHYRDTRDVQKIDTGLQIRGLSVGRSCFLVWSTKDAKIFRIDQQTGRIDTLDAMRASCVSMAIADTSFLAEEAWFVAEGYVVKINNFRGVQKGEVSFSEAEGTPVSIDVNDKFLAVMTSKGFIKIIDVYTPKKPKQVGSAGQFLASQRSLEGSSFRFKQIKLNKSGTMVAILCNLVGGSDQVNYPDSKLYVFDRTKGSIISYDFQSRSRYPVSIFWDESDDRLLVCETHCRREASARTDSKSKQKASEGAEKDEVLQRNSDLDKFIGPEVFLLFVTAEQGILMQDSVRSMGVVGSLFGLSAPHIFYRKVARQARDEEAVVSNCESIDNIGVLFRTMRDFVGIEHLTDVVKTSLLDFSYFLTLGKLDDAYRVVKEINSPSIWENMAQMCVKSKRLDVAEVCLGNMGHARGAAAVREAKKDGNVDVAIGVLAIQLGLIEDAANLFRDASRFDMLNALYQASGRWQRAISVAESKDRIHLKTTHYNYAKYLESIGRIDDAIEHYQLSNNARHEVPRMLFHLGRVEELGEYAVQTEDSVLLKWWASYMESIGRFENAKKYYGKAKDHLSLVRIACFQGDLSRAAEIVADTNDRASAYHFARQLEHQGEYQEAINFFAISGCYNHSIRLARQFGLDAELMRYAMKSTQALMVECAQHFESKGEYDKAMQLYHKGGDTPRALELCFRIGEEPSNAHTNLAFDMLNTIAQELGANSSPQLLARCGDFLVQHQQFEKAVDLYVMAKRYNAAIEMCAINRVSINETLADKLTPGDAMDPSERKEILKDLAKALKKQGSFALASKKYTQAGDRVRAIKCLVRSGDTKAVIQFATISRHPEIYTLAANYLQQMNWRGSMEIMKAIITFYTKAKAFLQLAGFYDSCAQVEIDEYRDYEKAIGALNEALKYLLKDDSRTARDMASFLEKRILLISKFVEAKASRRDPGKMVAICEALLQDPMVEDAIRAGDCYALLIEHSYSTGNYQDAYQYIKEMKERNIQVQPYVDREILEAVQKAVGVSSSKATANESKGDDEVVYSSRKQQEETSNYDIDEEIADEINEVRSFH